MTALEETPRIAATYRYTTEAGELLYEVVRLEPKTFRQRRPDGNGGWTWNLDGAPRVPYRLPQLASVANLGGCCFVVEGEKDADRIAHDMRLDAGVLTVAVTTNAGGSSWTWPADWAQHFRGFETVYVIADNDEPGRRTARQRADLIRTVCNDVRLQMALPGVPDKGDVTDYLDAGNTTDDLWRLVEGAPNVHPAEPSATEPMLADDGPPPEGAQRPALEVLRPFQRINVDLRTAIPPTPLLTDWLYGDGCLTVLQSEPGVGKSWIALWLCVAIINAGHDAIYIDEEGGVELVHERLTLLGADPDLVARHFHYFAFEARTWGEEDMLALTSMLATVERPRLAVLDSLPDFLAVAGQDEDRAKDVTSFIKKVCGAFREVGCAQLLLDHLPKPATDGKKHRSRYSRGSGSKLGKADATLLIEAEEEFDTHTSGKLRAWKTKDRRGRLPLPNLTKAGRLVTVTVRDNHVGLAEVLDADAGVERKPTVLMERISMAIEGRTDEVTQNGLLAIVSGNATYKKKALEHLIADGYVSREKSGQAYLIASIKPYRKPETDETEYHESWQP